MQLDWGLLVGCQPKSIVNSMGYIKTPCQAVSFNMSSWTGIRSERKEQRKSSGKSQWDIVTYLGRVNDSFLVLSPSVG